MTHISIFIVKLSHEMFIYDLQHISAANVTVTMSFISTFYITGSYHITGNLQCR